MLLSEIIRISNITPDRVSAPDNPKNKKYIRELYSNLDTNSIKSTLNFNLVGEPFILDHFKNLQRDITKDIFSLDLMKKLLDAIFVFHPIRITSQQLAKNTIYQNSPDNYSDQYKENYKKYYRDMAGILVEYGISEIKKNLHPEKDMPIIDQLDFIVNIIKKLDYHVEKISK